jgi:predicted ATPase
MFYGVLCDFFVSQGIAEETQRITELLSYKPHCFIIPNLQKIYSTW